MYARSILNVVLTVLIGSAALVIGRCCDCRKPPQREALQEAVMVFRGTVSKILPVPIRVEGKAGAASSTKFRGLAGEQRQLVTFRIKQVWKGDHIRIVTIHNYSKVDYCDCYGFVEGSDYTVYAVRAAADLAGWGDQYGSGHPILTTGALCILRIQTDFEDVNSLGAAWAPQ